MSTTGTRIPAALVLPAWVAAVDLAVAPSDPGRIQPALGPVAARHRGARLLMTRDGEPLAVVDVGVANGRVDLPELSELSGPWGGDAPATATGVPTIGLPTTTVAVCTRDRPEHLAVLLEHLRASPARDVALLVVDNAPSDDRSRDLVEDVDRHDPRLHYVREPRPGISWARDRALAWSAEAGSEVTVFVDDDVTMRAGWLAAVRTAIAPSDVSCVTGPVFAGTLETGAQLASDGALGWTVGFTPRRFALDTPSASPLFPFVPGEYGVGANFAVRTAEALALGGFDVHLGAGSPTRGGEDIEFWVRLVAAGHVLVYAPSTWVWHHHRESDEALRAQLGGYARGLGGYLGAVLCNPTMRRLAVRRLPRVMRHVVRLRGRERAVGVAASDGGFAPRAVMGGVGTYLRLRFTARRTGAAPRPD